MASRTREQRIIATVACPECGAAAGKPCTRPGGRTALVGTRLMVCDSRRAAWQEHKRATESLPGGPLKKE